MHYILTMQRLEGIYDDDIDLYLLNLKYVQKITWYLERLYNNIPGKNKFCFESAFVYFHGQKKKSLEGFLPRC